MKKNNFYAVRKNVLKELADSFSCIRDNFKYFNKLSKSGCKVLRACEWLLDNIYLIEKEYKAIRKEMPIDYFKGLPATSEEPRIFILAKNYINENGEIICDKLIEYINKSQNNNIKDNNTIEEILHKNLDSEEVTFTIGELWAFPLMLRIAVIINLSEYTNELVQIQKELISGRVLGEEIIESLNDNKVLEINEVEGIKINNNNKEKTNPLFLRELFKVLRENGVEDEKVNEIIKNKLGLDLDFNNSSIKSDLREEFLEKHIGDYINSIRKIEGISWRKFFENTSIVERHLKSDPSNIYNQMDFESKDYYRHNLEKLSRHFGVCERTLSKNVLELAKKSAENNEESYKCHVGYYLIDDGIKELKGYSRHIRDMISEKTYVYFNVLGTLILSIFLLFISSLLGVTYTRTQLIISFLIILIPINEIIMGFINWTVTSNWGIKLVPKLNFQGGIPDKNKAVVVIPAIVNSKEKIKELMERLEVAYCGNKDKNLFFALLCDFCDSNNEIEENDHVIAKFGIECARNLNEKYCNGIDTKNQHKFFFLTRKRVYNDKQNVYMARERKRGKLMEFMALIKGHEDHTYDCLSSNINELKNIKYLITLDEDTFMPRECAYKLVGAMSHVLNIPYVKDKKVIRGYGIMQPKVSISLESKNQSYFSRIFGGEEGVDGYSAAYSDTYQDLFGEGSFVGKGIIDIDEFYPLLNESIKENKILSHDLLEGAIARCALVSDVEFIDGYPGSYESSCRRLHRWVRGDWQLIGWLFSSKINLLYKWKIFDNLKRSLLAPNLLLALILSVTILTGRSQIAVLCFLGLIISTVFTVTDFVVTPKNKLMGTFKSFEQIILIIGFIPYQALLMIHAIIITLFRVCISKKNLLEWQSSEFADKSFSNDLSSYFKRMWISPLMGILIIYLSLNNSIGVITYNMAVAALWITSPYMAYFISIKTIKSNRSVLQDEEKIYLKKIARRIYAYYEDFINEENNYLAPDNYQEKPFKGVAHRTSPTNIGMGLVSHITAYDLGYITIFQFINKIELSLNSMRELKKVKGHYLNWYDTKTREPLFPRYISTVDSGNLLGALWVLKKAMLELKNNNIIRIKEIEALKDIYNIVKDEKVSIDFKPASQIKIGEYSGILHEVLVRIHEFRENGELDKINKARDEGGTNYNKSNAGELNYWLNKVENEVQDKINTYNSIFEGLDDLYSKEFFEGVPNLIELIHRCEDYKKKNGDKFDNLLAQKVSNFKMYLDKIDDIINEINIISEEMKFNFLYDNTRGLFSIGYNVEENSLGNSFYDLLASESRLASFIAISKNEVPQDHWFRLGRSMTNAFHTHALVSWSGTMFEYFMPSLIMKNYPKTLLSQTYKSVIKGQISFAKQKKIPWGISESAFYKFDIAENYQYKAFGVPGLGLKRGLEDEVVVSPYSTLMVLPFAKKAGIKNLKKLESLGAMGRYGFIESIDYTESRGDRHIMLLGKSKSEIEEIQKVPVDNYTSRNNNYRKKKNIFSINKNNYAQNVDNLEENVDNYPIIVDNMKNKNNNINVDNVDNLEADLNLNNKSFINHKEKINKIMTYMVHHLGMSLMSLDNILCDDILIKRFHSLPEIKATELLLKEKIPQNVTFERNEDYHIKNKYFEGEKLIPRIFKDADMDVPQILLLSNGSYSSMITASGSGYSKKNDIMLYRWKGNSTSDDSGLFFYIKNLNSNDYWSSTFEPCKDYGEQYSVEFNLDKVKFDRADGNIKTTTEVVLSTEHDFEVRKLTLTNDSDKSRSIEVTSYMEITLASFAADVVHPAFSNLFIQTEYDKAEDILIGARRGRVKNAKVPYIFHKVIQEGELEGSITYETSRINFIGRNRDLKNPLAMDNDKSLNNTVGTVLDPIMSLRARIRIEPNSKREIFYITGICESKEEIREICKQFNSENRLQELFNEYSLNIQLELKALGIKSASANTFQSAASEIFFLSSKRKNREDYIKNISRHQKDLWSYGISGDLPIIMLVLEKESDMHKLFNTLKFHYYLKLKGVKLDLIIYNNEEISYDEPLQKGIMDAIRISSNSGYINKPGGIFIHNKATMNVDIKEFIIGISRIYIDSENDINSYVNTSLTTDSVNTKQIKYEEYDHDVDLLSNSDLSKGVKLSNNDNELYGNKGIKDKFNKSHIKRKENRGNINNTQSKDEDINMEELDFYNNYGGFNKEDKSYVIKLSNYKNTPAPWINVISNDDFGFHISESGAGYTWCGNSRENKITPWSNDYIKDPPGEALYIKDNDSSEYFSICPKPVRDEGDYLIKHGFGFSEFKHTAYDLKGTLTVFAPKGEKVKIQKVILENLSSEDRDITVFYYAKLVLGVYEYDSSRYVSTYIKEDNSNESIPYIGARNPFSEYFGRLNAYLTISGCEALSFTGDNKEFIGIGSEASSPDALNKNQLSNKCGGIYDPCLAAAGSFKLKKGEKKEFAIIFGQEETENIGEVINKYNNNANVDDELDKVKQYWSNFLGNIQVKTPDKSLDYLLNGWLLYQTLSCRYLSRSAFYQSGGAYGFRDQLQDSMSLGLVDSKITKSQILRSASRQYVEGDVQHWWHPVVNSGIRTRFSDDLLWLPYVTAEYINSTGDYSILNEKAPYLEDEPLREGEDERYTIVNQSSKEGSIYEHCIKAIEKSLKFGVHNIPLMGSGDWNDGMSTVGNEGKGESVWLGWFLYSILSSFVEISEVQNDLNTKQHFEERKEFIRENLERNAWDGGWYRRAYFDDGTPLGSRENPECQIDSLAQSWAVISGALNSEKTFVDSKGRAVEAMEAVERNLVKRDKGMILLLAPPFDNSKLEPGYIKGYVPGVRENGGQYTHAAVWVILALTKLKFYDKATRYFNMINPINHTKTELECMTYKAEPYVMAADVYIKEPHAGRGGWSWYTGASGWMYKVGIENILGLKKVKGKGYTINPCVPKEWNEFEIKVNNEKEDYTIKITRFSKDNTNNKGAINKTEVIIDGKVIENGIIPSGIGKLEVQVFFQ